jgi:hypothetical protein
MSQKMSTGLCNYLLDTGSLKALFSGTTAQLRLYSGGVPASADAAAGTLIATIKEAGAALTFLAAAAAGVLAKSANVWSDPSCTGGTATYYRLVLSADDDTLSAVFKRVQGTVGVGGADMNVATTVLGAASVFTLNYFTQAIVPS